MPKLFLTRAFSPLAFHLPKCPLLLSHKISVSRARLALASSRGGYFKNAAREERENSVRLRHIFQKHPAQERGDLPLQSAGHIRKIILVAAEHLQCQKLAQTDSAGGILSKANDLGNDEGALGVCLGLP